MAKQLLAHVALCAILLVAASINMASACSCMMSHPQTHYCQADFGKNTKSVTKTLESLPPIDIRRTSLRDAPKRSGRELPPTVKVKNMWDFTFSSSCAFKLFSFKLQERGCELKSVLQTTSHGVAQE